ncbi:MAG TPA: prepilin-type N-terminal cleavage/methylation domain-containing protein [Blastocatellia bacterium]|nr:prepilin-type N-terminal cleavage/methylation domain-containing protein [Blastocatellia bacterium]
MFRFWILDFGGRTGRPAELISRVRSVQNSESRVQSHSGFTLLELIIVITILSVLTAAAVPMVRNSVRREREIELRLALRQLRQAIDRYEQ